MEFAMTNENVFRFTALLLFIAGFSISVYFRRKAEQQGQGDDIDFGEEKPWVYRLRVVGALLGYAGMLAYLVHPPLMKWSQLSLSDNLRWAGAAIMFLMLPMLYWLFSNLGNNVTPTVSIRQEHELVKTGPYRYIRHPLYTFGFLNFVGISLLSANWFILFSLMLGMVALVARTEKEEDKLIERFGESYLRYQERTGRFLPKLGPRNTG
jgi:protein-S-isoprenylcysteine O-methyltransferase